MNNSYNIASSLLYGKNILRDAKIASHNLEARLLLGFVLHFSAEKIISSPNYFLADKQFKLYQQLIARRANHEPIAHLLGAKEFFSIEFIVSKDTLIPRPDSETLIETVLAYFPDRIFNFNILDLGVGTGCLLLTLLTLYTNALGLGVDISQNAIEIARQNSIKLHLAQRSSFRQGDWGVNLPHETYDIIVSNPPYISFDDLNTLDPEVRQYEPNLALYGGQDGLDCYRKIAPQISKLLSNTGKAFIEIGYNQELLIQDIFTDHNLNFVRAVKDLNNIIRCLVFAKL